MIALVTVDAGLRDALQERDLDVVECSSLRQLREQLSASWDAVVIGAEVDDPVQGAAQAHQLDPAASVVILGADSSQCSRIRAALRFAPLIGSDVACKVLDDADAASFIGAAAERSRSRRTHQQVIASANAVLATRQIPAPRSRDRYLLHLLELAPVGIVATDAAQQVVMANAEAARVLGFSERELLANSLDNVGSEPGAWRSLIASATSEPGQPRQFAHATSEGLRALEARALVVSDAEVQGCLLVFQDVTERENAGKQLRIAYEKAEQASQLKDEFIAIISHELRTPLTSILGWTRMLRQGQVGPDKMARALEVIDRNANAQAALVEALLDMSSMVAGKLQLEIAPASLAELVESAVDSLTPASRAKSLHVVMELDPHLPPVPVDAQRMRQVLWNLLNNAVKFTPAGGTITVSLQQRDGKVCCVVADDGIGISHDLLPFVFDPFRQANGGTARMQGGLGLGLAIVRRLVEAHGGAVSVRSEGLGRGATFTVELPVRQLAQQRAPFLLDAPADDGPAVPAAAASLAGRRLLVVDDEADPLELISAVLMRAGAEVQTARSLHEAQASWSMLRPELVVSDIGMPGQDGYQLIAKLRAQLGAVPALALTAYASPKDRERALQSGFDAHAAKPIDPRVLVSLVARLLDQAGT